MSHTFNGKWLCDSRFLREPINVLHKEMDKTPIEAVAEELLSLHCLFVKKLNIDKKSLGRIKMDITADDYYKLYINGSFVCQGPAISYYYHQYWNSVDITDYLHEGENEILVHVYHSGDINRAFFSGDMRMGMICDLWSEGVLIAKSDESWQYAIPSCYTKNHYIGYKTQMLEDYDCTAPVPEYKPCAINENIDYTFADDPIPTIPVYDKAPVASEKLADGGIFYDFGTEITGTLVFTALGKKGDKVRILCGEELCDEPQRVRYNMRCNCVYEQYMTLDDGKCVFDEYDYKGFRYVTLYPDNGVEVSDFYARVRHWYFDDDYCRIETNDKILESVFNICKNGVKYGTQEVYVDCPQREKGQYAGDMTITSASHLWLTGDNFMFRKAIDSQVLSTRICPGIMAVTPGALMQEIADYSLQFPILALRDYEFTGDKEYLKRNLEYSEKMMQHFAKFAREDGLVQDVTDKWNLVDWPRNLRDDYALNIENPIAEGLGVHNVINAFYAGCASDIDRIKKILGIPCDDRATRLREAFNNTFFNKKTGLYTDTPTAEHSSIHSNMVPIYYGLQPEGSEKAIGDWLVDRVKDGIPCGVYMSYFLLKGLCRLGRYDDVYKILTSQAENSWYNMVREGGTTCFEAWGVDKKSNTSLCHPWASAPVSIIIEDILGYRFDGTRGKSHIPQGVKIELVRGR
ncbi:MAG: alpha-L-rhamnosidase [Ruminococcaceae bacterium]|nr:alpha-L-rhamnosidase [Oscillospiraceae bacterium]